ncbi:MAG: YdaU family protein [Psychrobacter sp.]|nr:YdaU family protein [Psychrobacter sp.]
MHFYNFNPSVFNNSARHLSLVERAIYRDLIDMYYVTEQAIDGSDMPMLERKLMCRTDSEKQALQNILTEFFTKKRSGKYHIARIDNEIRKYQHSEKIKEYQLLRKIESVELAAKLYFKELDSNGNSERNDSNGERNAHNETMSNADRAKLYRLRVKNISNELESLGAELPSGKLTMAELTKLCEEYGIDANDDKFKADHSNNERNESESNERNDSRNDQRNESNGKNHSYNYELETKNQELLTNSLKQKSAGEIESVLTKDLDQERQMAKATVSDWVEPSLESVLDRLAESGDYIRLTPDIFKSEIKKFKAHYADKAFNSNKSFSADYLFELLHSWFVNSAERLNAAKAPVVEDTDYSMVGRKPQPQPQPQSSNGNPSAATTEKRFRYAPSATHCVVANGLWYEPFPGLSANQTQELLDIERMPGEVADEVYERLYPQYASDTSNQAPVTTAKASKMNDGIGALI